MTKLSAAVTVPGRAFEAEQLWYDPQRWPAWVDGFGFLVELAPEWPQAGAKRIWTGRPGGRGRVLELVTSYEARTGQELRIEDGRLRGTQHVAFEPGGDGVTIRLSLDYELKQRHPLSFAVDALFVRRSLAESLRLTLVRFARERRGDLELGVESG